MKIVTGRNTKLVNMLAISVTLALGCKGRSTTGQSEVLGTPKLNIPEACFTNKDVEAEDFDLTGCPAIPDRPGTAEMTVPEGNVRVVLGSWEVYPGYKWGGLETNSQGDRVLKASETEKGIAELDQPMLDCWAKGYYRLQLILRNPPASYVSVFKKGRKRFFQFLSDNRKPAPDGGVAFGGKLYPYSDLIKWHVILNQDGSCKQFTRSDLDAFSKEQLAK